MKILKLGNITIEADEVRTRKFYEKQSGFTCKCSDCTNYVSKVPYIQTLLNGIDIELGIDLSRDVGQGMDELIPHDYEGYHLYLIPYYVIGGCYHNGEELDKEQSGPIWSSTRRAEYKLTDDLSLLVINTSGDIEMDTAENVLTIWFEFKAS
ncbi:hypothetical protein R9C00_24335 [Flammeovirgaceae bacterium SG7u.111]|nr:hypothetical protein [Flammeovirgaceae bacterium SG7u.132]WPO34831.1 hypothetical protein R9C00_24335 [Flammeovirgaceae bacterium SG7u.111]